MQGSTIYLNLTTSKLASPFYHTQKFIHQFLSQLNHSVCHPPFFLQPSSFTFVALLTPPVLSQCIKLVFFFLIPLSLDNLETKKAFYIFQEAQFPFISGFKITGFSQEQDEMGWRKEIGMFLLPIYMRGVKTEGRGIMLTFDRCSSPRVGMTPREREAVLESPGHAITGSQCKLCTYMAIKSIISTS